MTLILCCIVWVALLSFVSEVLTVLQGILSMLERKGRAGVGAGTTMLATCPSPCLQTRLREQLARKRWPTPRTAR
jgi:hypothetical protein